MPEPTPAPPRRRRVARIAAIAAALLVALVAAAYLLLPWIGRPLLERTLSTALGAPVAIGALHWQPTAGWVEAQRVAIGAAGEQVGAARVLVEGDVRALWRGQLVLDRLEIEAPTGGVELDARYRPVLPGRDTSGAAPARLPPVTLRQLLVTDGEITVRYPVQRELRAAQLHITRLTASDISADGGAADLAGQLSGTLDGAPLEVSGRLHLSGDAVDIDATGGVSGLVVNRRTVNLLPALDTFHATVDLRATYTATTTPATQRLSLDVTLHEPRITDEAGTEFAAQTVVLPGVAVDLLSGAIAVDHIAVDQPAGALQLDAQFRPTLARFGRGSSTAAGPPPPVAVRELVITDGTLTLRYPVAGQLRAAPLQITRLVCSNIALSEGRVAMDATLDGTLDGAPLQVEAHLRPGESGRAVDADVRLSDLTVDRAHLDLPSGFETFRARVDVHATIAAPAPSTPPTARLDLRLREPRFAPAGAELTAKSVSLPALEIDLAQRRINAGAVTVDAPTIDLTVPVVAGGEGGGASAWAVRSDAIDVRNARLRLRRGDTALAFAIPTLRWGGWIPEQPRALSLRATGDGGAAVSVDGALGLAPLDAALEVRARALPLPALARLLDALPVQLANGSGDATLRVSHQGGRLRIHGTGQAEDVHTLPPDPSRPVEVMAVNRADATLTFDSGATPPLDVGSLTLSYPYVMVQRRAAGTFPTTLFATPASQDAGDAPGDGTARARLRQLQIEGGKLEFIDTTLEPDFWTSFSHMTAEATELRLPPSPGARFTVTAKRDEISSVEISGAYTATGLEGRATLQDAMLASFNPYVAPLLGYDVTAGWLSLVLRATPAPPRYDATAQLVLRGVEVTQTGVDAIQSQSGVPLPIALSLIADSSGQIDMTLPLAFDAASGRITIGSIIGQAVRSAIVGALTSPLRILGSLFGTKGAPHAFAIDPIPFPAGVATLDAAGAARVAEIARILQAHPGLVLVAAPQISATELSTLGARDAQALADDRLATVRTAFTGTDAAYRLPPARLMPVPWTPPTDKPPSGQPGVYVELQDQP